MWEWDLIRHVFRILWASAIALLLVAAIFFTAYRVMTFVMGIVLEMYETIHDRRMIKRREQRKGNRAGDEHG